MKRLMRFWLPAAPLAFLLSFHLSYASALAGIRGYSLTELYAYQDAAAIRHAQLYQTLSFRLDRLIENRLSLVAHLRYQGDSADEFAESGAFKLHNLYLRWADTGRFDGRLGRQFLSEGVGFGTYDALRLCFSPVPWGRATFWAGLAAPADRAAEVRDLDDAKAVGLSLRGRIRDQINLVGSLLLEDRQAKPFHRRAGISFSSPILGNLSASGLIYLNLSSPSALHRARLFMRYGPVRGWRLFGEFAHGTPDLPVNSPFDVLEIAPFELVRLGSAYNIYKEYWIGLKAQSFLSGKTPNTTLGLHLDGSWGSVGYRQRFGDYGEESGFFGSARLDIAAFAQIYAGADFSLYKFEEREDENQAAGQVGLRLFPLKALLLDASVQGLKNEQFDQDLRGLLRLKWTFSN